MLKKLLLASVAAGSVIVATNAAQAGGFALREQSAAGQGLSFAGAAAGGAGLGSMFWNPATMTNYQGIQTSVGMTALIPYTSLSNVSGTGAGYAVFTGGKSTSNDMAFDALVPNAYLSWQLNQNIWLGLSVNAPFGLGTKPDSSYVGRTYGSTSAASSKEVTATVAYKINESLSIAGGLRYLDMKARYTTGSAYNAAGVRWDTNPANWPVMGLMGDGAAFGYTMGITFKPLETTEVGIGYRSEVKPTLKGDFFGAATALGAGYASLDTPVQLSVPLPQMITIGVKHKITQELTLLAGYEWTNWSTLKSPAVTKINGGAVHSLFPTGLPFDYKDGWYASLGAEYQWDSKLTLRTGLGFESTPIKDSSRSTRLPDNDRIWTSIGAGYKFSERLSLDVGYTHIFPKSTKVTIDAANPNYKSSPSYVTPDIDKLNVDVNAHVDIVSVNLTYRFDTPTSSNHLPGKVTK